MKSGSLRPQASKSNSTSDNHFEKQTIFDDKEIILTGTNQIHVWQ